MMPPWNEATELRTPNCTFRQVSSPKQHRAAATGRPFGFWLFCLWYSPRQRCDREQRNQKCT